jgi:hypothetical protein
MKKNKKGQEQCIKNLIRLLNGNVVNAKIPLLINQCLTLTTRQNSSSHQILTLFFTLLKNAIKKVEE